MLARHGLEELRDREPFHAAQREGLLEGLAEKARSVSETGLLTPASVIARQPSRNGGGLEPLAPGAAGRGSCAEAARRASSP